MELCASVMTEMLAMMGGGCWWWWVTDQMQSQGSSCGIMGAFRHWLALGLLAMGLLRKFTEINLEHDYIFTYSVNLTSILIKLAKDKCKVCLIRNCVFKFCFRVLSSRIFKF